MEKKIVLQGGTTLPRPERLRDTYFIGSFGKGGKLRAIKIGVVSRGKVQQRLQNLRVGSLDRLEILSVYNGNLERKLHRYFKKSRLRKNSEYFKPTAGLLKLIADLNEINSLLERLDVAVSK